MGRHRSQRSQFGEVSSFPKKPMKFQIILSKIMPTRKEADRVGGACSQLEFQEWGFNGLRSSHGRSRIQQREQRGLTESQEERPPAQRIREYSPLRKESQQGETASSAGPFQTRHSSSASHKQGHLRLQPSVFVWTRTQLLEYTQNLEDQNLSFPASTHVCLEHWLRSQTLQCIPDQSVRTEDKATKVPSQGPR